MPRKIIGKRRGGDPKDEREHFIKCPACGRWIDMRHLDDVLAHERACGGTPAPPAALQPGVISRVAAMPIIDIYDGQPWSEMDVKDLRIQLEQGFSIEEIARFLCRSGTVHEVRRKAEELGLIEAAQN